jgi:type IV pilus assembly protein PilB
VTTQSRPIQPAVVSRLKIMADLDIAERRVPQDGRMSITATGRPVDVRVSTLPTVHGETLVLRILDQSAGLLDVRELGFLDSTLARYESAFRKPYGLILASGPTGSGKTTTLYAALNAINRPDVHVVTVEDPVEYELPGVSQVHVQRKAGLTFAAALRAILRQDPDVVLVGEIRDEETANIAMEAALTGHLVLSTLHANGAPSTVTRLIEMRIDPFLVAASLDCVVAQRLARRLCPRCRAPVQLDRAALEAAGVVLGPDDPLPALYSPVGCGFCARTGYKGRIALHEVMPVTEELERTIAERASTDELGKFAQAQGMRTMREDGLAKVLLGHTTLDEVARVIA